jgi:protein SCO1/2
MKNFKTLLIFVIIPAIILSMAFASFLMYKEVNKKQLPVLGRVYDFVLTDEKGDSFSFNKLKNKIWVVDFIFTTCSDICPIMTKNMAKLDKTFAAVDGIKLVSITVNPEQDSPEILKKYSEKYDANSKKWHFLTGSRDKIREIVLKSFKLGSIEEPIFHSSYFTLVDQNGLIRGYYDGLETKDINKLFKDAASLLKEK